MADPQYVNQGPDKRFGGPLGHVLAFIQRALSFHSSTPPYSFIYRRNFWKVGIEFSRPGLLPFVLVFIPHRRRYVDLVNGKRQRWYSFRAGWRFDHNWGGGGYFPDIIIKLRIDNLAE